jgi:uncharacterized protein
MAVAVAPDSKIKIARPTINVNGRDNASLSEGLLRLTITECVIGLYRCEAQFGNLGVKNGRNDFLYFDRATLDFGKPLIIKLGTDKIFEGRIMGLEGSFPSGGSPEITVLAEDRFQDLRMTRRTRTFLQSTDSSIFNQIANDHGLTAQVSVSGPQHNVLAQVNQSDLAFMRERARAIDAELWIDGTTLNVKPRSQRGRDKIELTYTNELYEFNVIADLANQRTAVIATGWDVSSKSAIKHEAAESIISGELNGLTSGVKLLKDAIGERKEQLAHTVPLSTQEAQFRAESYFRASARRFVIGRGIAEGNAKLRVGSTVDLKGLGPLFSGKYYISEVQFVFGADGLTTEFVAERPGIGSP